MNTSVLVQDARVGDIFNPRSRLDSIWTILRIGKDECRYPNEISIFWLDHSGKISQVWYYTGTMLQYLVV